MHVYDCVCVCILLHNKSSIYLVYKIYACYICSTIFVFFLSILWYLCSRLQVVYYKYYIQHLFFSFPNAMHVMHGYNLM